MTLRAVPDPDLCSACGKTQPRDFCWDGKRVGCPMNRPPRNVDALDMWRVCHDQEARIAELEVLCAWMGTLVLSEHPEARDQLARLQTRKGNR